MADGGDLDRAALLAIDVQRGFEDPAGAPGNAFKDGVAGDCDVLVVKHVNSAFYGEPDLHRWLQAAGIGSVVVAGITTNHCCETTAPMAGNLGLPIACTLGGHDGAVRMQRWRALSAAAGHPAAQRDQSQLSVRFEAARGVREELQALAAAERQCCSFAEWEVAEETGYVVLRVTSDAEGIAAIADLFGATGS